MDDALVQEGDILPGCANFEEFVQAAYPIVMNGVRLSNNLPSTQQYSYFKTYKEFEDIMKAHGKRLQDTIQMLLVHMDTKRTIHHQPADEKFELIVDTNDKLLDRAHKSMSEMDGTRFNPDEDFGESSHRQISGSWNRKNLDSVKLADKADDVVKLTVQQRTIRPQALFKDKIDNSNRPWEPRIKEKPNALKPLSVLLTVNERGQETYTHPYEFELDMWKPSEERLTLVHVVEEPKDLEETQLIYVQTEKELELMVADLLQQNEFSVDLEHHSYRSFMGFTCLMQISTKDTDFIIDALKLRHKMHILNTVFTKPNILKIFHGASNDIDWLQRDFSLYVVNMFDTYQAAKVLDFPKLSLAYLLKHYCKIEASKKFQLYDWRIRPLPNKAKNYAREDTHYLIYIYQMMNNELFAKGNGPRLIDVVYKKSIETCKQVYMKPLLDENSHMNLYRRMGRPFDTRQLFALKEIYKWRDNVAREEDESPGYVLSNHMMMQMAQTLPREVQGILACCNPIPPLVRQHAVDIHKIILKAKEVPLVKTFPEETVNKSSSFSASRDLELEVRLNYYTHDNSGVEYRDDLPTKLNGKIREPDDPPHVRPVLSVLAEKNDDIEEVVDEMMKISFVSPYERYIKVLPYSIQMERQEIEKQMKQEAEMAERRSKIQNMDVTAIKRTQDDARLLNRFASELPEKKARLTDDDRPVGVTVTEEEKHNVEDVALQSFGVVGGEIAVAKEKKRAKRRNNALKDFEPYDYSVVNFNKFHSSPGGQAMRVTLPSNSKNQNKRKLQFQGKHQMKKRKGQRW
ncbi:exosome component 10 isoform X2 [Cimex lectularius]|uniref:Exosome complex component 10 homolog n=1 Tax=Cimex lectularius TaxID=79782 RepID=A0A8I6S4W1_CIMLE|nr:exosome component 10 isoform X2 [Cimex lectularius]